MVLSSGVVGDHYTIRSEFPFDVFGIKYGYGYLKCRPVIDVYLDYLLYRKVFDNYILYRNGIDITADFSKIAEKDLNDRVFSTILYWAGDKIKCADNIQTEIIKISFKDAVYAYVKESPEEARGYLSNCDGWFCIYRVILTLDELERFNVNYQIHSKGQK